LGAQCPKSIERWARLTLLVNGLTEVLEEDMCDLVDFLEYTGRTIPRDKWAVEAIDAAQRANLEAIF
jgi:hypothetical protein